MDGDSCRKATKKLAKKAKPCNGNCNCKQEKIKKSEKTDCCNDEKTNRKDSKQDCDPLSNVRNVLPPAGIRCNFQTYSELHTFLLDYGRNFLLYIGSIFWIIFLLLQN